MKLVLFAPMKVDGENYRTVQIHEVDDDMDWKSNPKLRPVLL